MDWGLGNPNKTAALIATLMVGVWAFAYFRRWGFWLALLIFTGLGVCLIHTFSRGGLVAAVAGIAVLAWFVPRPWPWRRIVAAGISLWLIIGASLYLQAHERYTQGVGQEDRSISNRFELWKYAPQMMVDAPGGWGVGKSGKAFMDWYQPLDRHETYRTLVNSHLTWLVELGWLGRFGYLVGWGLVFLLCWPSRQDAWISVPLGIWTAFATGAFFSSVAESPWLWILPISSLLTVLGWRFVRQVWPERAKLPVPAAVAAIVLLGLWLLTPRSSITKGESGQIVAGRRPPIAWVVADPVVLGKSFPRPLREAVAQNPNLSCGVVERFADLPPGPIPQLIIAGGLGGESPSQLAAKMAGTQSIVLVNPSFPPLEVALPQDIKTEVIIGEFAQRASSADWAQVAAVRRLEGVGDFVPEWPQQIFPTP